MLNLSLPENNQIIAIIPTYTPEGEQTHIYIKSTSPLIFRHKPSTLVRHLAARQAIDLYYLKTKAAKLTRTVLWQPLVITPELLLVPMKIRKPKVSGDSTTGYFNFHEISHAFTQQGETFLSFKNGLVLPVLWTKKTIDDHLQKAHLLSLENKRYSPSIESFIASLLTIPSLTENIYLHHQ